MGIRQSSNLTTQTHPHRERFRSIPNTTRMVDACVQEICFAGNTPMLVMAYGMTHEEGAMLGLTGTVPEKQMEGTAGGKKCMVGKRLINGSPSAQLLPVVRKKAPTQSCPVGKVVVGAIANYKHGPSELKYHIPLSVPCELQYTLYILS